MRISKKIFSIFFITLVTLLFVFSNTAFAAMQIDTQRNTSLTIYYDINKNPVSGIGFRLYRVADISPIGRFTATGDFAGYSVSFDRLTSEGWTDLARTLEGYVLRDNPKPAMSGVTDEGGTVSFPNCAQGLYLLIGDKHTSGRYVYTPQSLMVSLPSMNNDYSWNYDVISEPKYIGRPDIGSSGYTQYIAKKVWNDDGDTSKRSQEVVVQLLCDDGLYDERTLNEANNWQHIWSNLPRNYTWRVVEKSVPDEYTISVSENEYIFTITNTLHDGTPDDPDEPPSNPGNPTGSTNPTEPNDPSYPNNPDNPTDSGTPDNPDDPDHPNGPNDTPGSGDPNSEGLPQTGMLKWPIPVMFILGAGIFVTGYYFYRKRDTAAGDEDE